MLSEPRLKETGINVLLDNGEIQPPLTKVTPLANALKRRQTPPRWAVMIASPEKYVDRLREVWRRVIFS